MVEPLAERLKAQSSSIADLLRVSGAPGLSLGVFHHGRIIHMAHMGRRDVNVPDPPNDQSIYRVAFTFKIVTAAAVGRLVTDGVLCWDVPIHNYLPGLRRRDEFGLKATLRDLLSNRTGLPMASFYWGQQNGEQLLDKSHFVDIVDSLPAVKPLKRTFLYSQWNYCFIQLIIEKMAGKSFGSYVQETIFDPLGLETATFETPAGTNIVKPHGTRSDGSSSPIDTSSFDSSTGLAAGSGGKTSLRDQLTLYIALLDAYRHQTINGVDTTPNSPFTQLRTIFSPHISLAGSPLEKQAYCLGLYRTQLPGNLSCASLNAALPRKDLPLFGAHGGGETTEEVFHHAANFPGSIGAMFLVPRTHSGVVVMSNATPLMDAPDFIGQVLLSILLDSKPPPNLLSVARMSAKVQLSWFEQLQSVLDGFRTDTPPTHPLPAYAGTYFNAIGNFKIVVSPQQAGLRLSVQGLPITTYDRSHMMAIVSSGLRIGTKRLLIAAYGSIHFHNFMWFDFRWKWKRYTVFHGSMTGRWKQRCSPREVMKGEQNYRCPVGLSTLEWPSARGTLGFIEAILRHLGIYLSSLTFITFTIKISNE